MADKALDTYLNDHLAGAAFGADLARQIESQAGDGPTADRLRDVAGQVEEDRRTLLALMDRLGASRSPIKESATWLAEKAGRIKFSGLTSGERELGLFMALETLSLGVEGKASLWRLLRDVADRYPELDRGELDALLARAEAQRRVLEEERAGAGRRAFAAAG
jgi:hypothetical protein